MRAGSLFKKKISPVNSCILGLKTSLLISSLPYRFFDNWQLCLMSCGGKPKKLEEIFPKQKTIFSRAKRQYFSKAKDNFSKSKGIFSKGKGNFVNKTSQKFKIEYLHCFY